MNEESLFHEALAQPTPQERAAFLAQACAGRPELRAAVEALLAAHEQPGDLLVPPVLAAAIEAADPAPAVAPVSGRETQDLAGSTDADSRPGGPRTGPDRAGEATPPVEVPRRIGRYEVVRLLGRGGMGAVYLAHDPELDRPVALKVPQLAGTDAEERFLREARAAAAVAHPNLCPVHDTGRADGLLYLAMAYVPGPTLTEVLRDQGPLPPARAAALAAGVARGMAEAHRHHIVHRDLKPGNILLDRRGEPVVTDFGLALRASVQDLSADPAATAAHDPRLTQTGVLLGTPTYMPPEQARGDLERIGPACDVYALGAILFELLTGQPPFPASSLREILHQIETRPAPLPSRIRPGVPPGLDAVCRRALAKDPAERFPSMEAFAEALAPFAAGGGRRRRRLAVTLVAAVLVLLAAAAAVFYVSTDHGTVEVRLSDPSADVQVAVDGNEVRVTEGGRVTKLRAGPHGLEVKGREFETVTRLFKVTRGEKTVLEVELRPRKVAAVAKPGSAPAPPDRAQLAALLARGGQLIHQGRFDELEGTVREGLRIDPDSPGVLALRATLRAARNDLEGARADVEAALRLNPETPRALLVRTHLNSLEGKPADSVADATVAIRLDPTSAPLWSNRSAAYIHLGEYRQAVADASETIRLGFKRPDPYLNRGGAYACLGEYDKALADYDAAARIAPFDARVFVQRSSVHAAAGNEDAAAADWAKARKLDPTLKPENRPVIPPPPRPPKRKKLTTQQAKELERALAAFEQGWRTGDAQRCLRAAEDACRIDPTSPAARSARARIWAQTGRPREAGAEAVEVLRLDPNNAWAYSVRGYARANTTDLAGGIADLTIALRLDPSIGQAWNTRGWAYLGRGQYHQAVADLTEALRFQPQSERVYELRGASYAHLGDHRKALADYAKVAQLQPTNVRWRLICSVLRARLGDADGARKDRARAIEIDPKAADRPDPAVPIGIAPAKKDPEPPTAAAPAPDRAPLAGLLARGRRLIDQDQYDGLAAVADEALKIDAQSPGALALRATVRALRGDRAGTRADAEAALKLNPETFHALIPLAAQRGEEAKPDEVIALGTIAARLDPKHPAPWALRAQAYLDKQEYRQAVADATQALDRGRSRRPDAFLTRAAGYVHLGEYAKALADLDEAARFLPHNPSAFAQRSGIQAKLRNAEKAAADWATARKLDPALGDAARPVVPDPPKPPARKRLGPADAEALSAALTEGKKALGERRLADARKAAEEAVGLDPTCAAAHALRAWLLGYAGQYRPALAAADEAIRLDPGHALAYAARGSSRGLLNDQPGAIADQTIALTLDPELATAWNGRGNAYHRWGRYHQAIADINESLRRDPNDLVVVTNRGFSYLYLGEYEKALADFDRAADLQPTHAQWRRICGAIRARLGNDAAVRRDQERAARLDPELANAPCMILPVPVPAPKTDPELPPGDSDPPAGR